MIKLAAARDDTHNTHVAELVTSLLQHGSNRDTAGRQRMTVDADEQVAQAVVEPAAAAHQQQHKQSSDKKATPARIVPPGHH